MNYKNKKLLSIKVEWSWKLRTAILLSPPQVMGEVSESNVVSIETLFLLISNKLKYRIEYKRALVLQGSVSDCLYLHKCY